MACIGFEKKFEAAGEDPAKLAAAVTESQAALCAFANLPRRTFRRLVPRERGKLQKDVLHVVATFFDCVVADVRTNKAELGSVWKARSSQHRRRPPCPAHASLRHRRLTPCARARARRAR
jgi:hypothetical protein